MSLDHLVVSQDPHRSYSEPLLNLKPQVIYYQKEYRNRIQVNYVVKWLIKMQKKDDIMSEVKVRRWSGIISISFMFQLTYLFCLWEGR